MKGESTCGGKRINARCVDYEGTMSTCTELKDECKRYSVHETLEDVNNQLTRVCEELDMSGVDLGCIEFEGQDMKLPDLMKLIIDRVCTANEMDCEAIMSSPIDCAELKYHCLVDDCGEQARPNNLKELLQLLINAICSGGPVEPTQNVIVEAGENIQVEAEQVGGITTYTVSSTKEHFYREFVSEVDISQNAPSPGPSDWHFPVGYEVLEYENTRATPMNIEVHISYEEGSQATPEGFLYNEVSSAIIRTNGAGDTPEYYKQGTLGLGITVYDETTGQPASVGDSLQLSPSGNPARLKIQPAIMTKNTSYFKVLTLAPSEKVSLKFSAKAIDRAAKISRAQILVKEL